MLKTVSNFFSQSKLLIKRLGKPERFYFMAGMALATTGILSWLVYRQRNLLLSFHWEFRPIPIILSFVLYSLTLFQMALAWSMIIYELGGKTSFQKHFSYFCVSNLAKRLPGTIWYIPWRGKMYESLGISPRLISIASGIEMALLVVSGIMASLLFAIPVISRYQYGILFGAVLFFISLAFVHPRVIRKIAGLLHVEVNEIKYVQILKWVVLYASFWMTSGIMLFSIVNIFYPLPVAQLGYVIGVWTLTGVLSFSLVLLPSNLGFTEISISLLLSAIIPSPIAVVIAIGARILLFFYELLWASAIILLEYRVNKKIIH